MRQTVESFITQGNTWFFAGNHNKALQYYYKALQQAKAFTIVVKYVQKNKENLFEDQELLKEFLHKKYNILLTPGAISLLLLSIQKQVEKKEEQKAYQQFKKLILSQHPKTPEQYVDVLLQHYDDPPWQEMIFLSQLLLEHGLNYYVCDVDQLVHQQTRAQNLKRFEQSLQENTSTKFSDIDTMSGYEFEEFLMHLFTKLGYTVEHKKRSREQGLDLLLIRHGEKSAVQVKRYSKPVGNKAIQQANAARTYHHCKRALVVTNTSFTRPAQQLAARCNVELWDRHTLKEKMKSIL